MSPPIIKYALQLVDAEINIEILETIKDVSKSVYIIADEFTQQDLDNYSTIMNSGTQEVWMSNADAPNARLRPVMAASTSEYPEVCISPGIILSRPDLQEPGTPKPPILTYIFLVQGRNDSE